MTNTPRMPEGTVEDVTMTICSHKSPTTGCTVKYAATTVASKCVLLHASNEAEMTEHNIAPVAYAIREQSRVVSGGETVQEVVARLARVLLYCIAIASTHNRPPRATLVERETDNPHNQDRSCSRSCKGIYIERGIVGSHPCKRSARCGGKKGG